MLNILYAAVKIYKYITLYAKIITNTKKLFTLTFLVGYLLLKTLNKKH